jgi:hypothetical protein
MLLPTLDAYTTGQLLALYEHRVATMGFISGINSFDQWGLDLGKVVCSTSFINLWIVTATLACMDVIWEGYNQCP